MAGDMKGPLRPDINGNMWHLVLVDMNSKQGYVHSLPSKHSGGVKIGVQKFWATLKKTMGSAMDISLFHSDDGTCKELMGELDDFLLTMGVTRTNTGGYAAKYNVIVEQQIKTLLVGCALTSPWHWGRMTTTKNWLERLLIKHANHLINVIPWTNEKFPYETPTGKPYVMDNADRVFGCLVLIYIKKELRRSASTPVATMGI
jgi:hypothetical protein